MKTLEKTIVGDMVPNNKNVLWVDSKNNLIKYNNNNKWVRISNPNNLSPEIVPQLNSLGYTYIGVAAPSTTPITLTGDEKVFYIATEEGDYSNFGLGNISELSIIKSENRSWKAEGFGVPFSVLTKTDIANNLTSKNSDKPLSAYQGYILSVISSLKKDSFQDITNEITLISGYRKKSDGSIITQGSGAYHTSPIPVYKGETIAIRTYTGGPYQLYETDADGSYYRWIEHVIDKQIAATGNGNINTYTALKDTYVCANIYETGAGIHGIYKFYSGFNFDLMNRLSSVEKDVSAIKEINIPNYTEGTYLDNNGNLQKIPGDLLYQVDDFYYILPDTIKIQSIRMANNFPIIAFYDKDKAFISAIKSKTSIDINLTRNDYPENAVYFRIANYNDTQPFYEFSPNLDALRAVTTPTEEIFDLEKRLADLGNSSNINAPRRFTAFSDKNTLAVGETLALPSNKVKKNTTLTANIKGFRDKISVGVGYSTSSTYLHRTYDARWVEIDNTNVNLYASFNNTSPTPAITSKPHGLNLTEEMYISIVTKMENNSEVTNIHITTSNGDEYTEKLSSWGQGIAFVTNNNTSNHIEVDLTFMVGDITKDVWLFGDSYFSYWMNLIYSRGIHNFLNSSQPGSSPSLAYEELQNLLSLGYTPSYILWALGMNGDTTESKVNGAYVVNSYQKGYIDSVKTLCESKGIIPVFVAVPSTPSRKKTGFKAYIESLGCRYVNLYDALGCSEYGVWTKYPTLYAWKNEVTIVYTLKYERALKSGDPIFDINGNATSKTISSVVGLNGNGFTNASTIVVDDKTYTYSSSDNINGLLGDDSVHPRNPIGANVIAQVFLNEFPEIAIQ